jgi:hypothetical protein
MAVRLQRVDGFSFCPGQVVARQCVEIGQRSASQNQQSSLSVEPVGLVILSFNVWIYCNVYRDFRLVAI